MSIVYNSSKTSETVNRAIDNNMGTTTTEQGASSAGLIISEDLQPIVQCVTGFDYHISDKTIQGVPPLTFHAIAQHLTDWSIDGNTDSGESVGDKTDNIFDGLIGTDNALLNAGGGVSENNDYALSNYIPISANEDYTFSFLHTISESRTTYTISFYDIAFGIILPLELQNIRDIGDYYIHVTSPANAKYLRINWKKPYDVNMMLLQGDNELPYEPYGYDVPIKVNNTDTYHCYITDVLRKSSGDTPVYDTMLSDGTIIRRVDTDGTPLEDPTTETYTAPDIVVNWGYNTIDVDTTVTPSSMTINYKDD